MDERKMDERESANKAARTEAQQNGDVASRKPVPIPAIPVTAITLRRDSGRIEVLVAIPGRGVKVAISRPEQEIISHTTSARDAENWPPE